MAASNFVLSAFGWPRRTLVAVGLVSSLALVAAAASGRCERPHRDAPPPPALRLSKGCVQRAAPSPVPTDHCQAALEQYAEARRAIEDDHGGGRRRATTASQAQRNLELARAAVAQCQAR